MFDFEKPNIEIAEISDDKRHPGHKKPNVGPVDFAELRRHGMVGLGTVLDEGEAWIGDGARPCGL